MWLLSQGSYVNVIGPQELRDKWKAEIQKLNTYISKNL